MKNNTSSILFLIFVQFCIVFAEEKKPRPYAIKDPSNAQFNNPNFIKDRLKNIIKKPEYYWSNAGMKNFSLPSPKHFDASLMDYCDPHHCNDYHKTACGLNRRNQKFKWFQSACHIILNNMCSTYRGTLRYDPVDIKFCHIYVMHLRIGCPIDCEEDKSLSPVCGISSIDNHVVLFKNMCVLESTNCKSDTLHEYEPADMKICRHHLNSLK